MLGATDPNHTSFIMKFAAGGMSGFVASIIANPTDLLKIRMQAWEGEPRNVFWHISQVHKKSGLIGFYRGLQATVSRAIVLNAVKLSTYDHIKHTLINWGVLKDGYLLHFVASLCAGVCMATATAPFDMARTRLMNQSFKNQKYKGMLDVFV